MYVKQIEQLVVLQKVDDEIVILKAELENAPKEIESLETRYCELDQGAAVVREKVVYLQEQRKKLEGDIENDSVRLKKSKNKLMMVGNTKEYHAMMREMDNLEKQNRGREEEKVAIAEELARQSEALAEIDGRLSVVREELAAGKANLDARVRAATKRLAELDGLRSVAGHAVPAPILKRYEFIRARLNNPVIVPVKQGVCSGCHISIPPQSFIELQKGIQILSCPNCQRLIYWSDHIPAPVEAEKTPEEATA